MGVIAFLPLASGEHTPKKASGLWVSTRHFDLHVRNGPFAPEPFRGAGRQGLGLPESGP